MNPSLTEIQEEDDEHKHEPAVKRFCLCFGPILAAILTVSISFALVGICFFVVGFLVTLAMLSINVFVGIDSGSAFVQGNEGEVKLGSVSLQWVIGKLILFLYVFYPLLIQIIQTSIAFCCPPKLADAPLIKQRIEDEYKAYLIKKMKQRTLLAIKMEAYARNKALKKELAVEAITIKYKKLESEEARKKELAEMEARVRAKHEMELKRAVEEKYAKLKQLEEEKAKLIMENKLTLQKQKELELRQAKIEKIEAQPSPILTTGLFTEETQRPGKSETKIKGIPQRRGSIDTKATGKTAATKANNPRMNAARPINKGAALSNGGKPGLMINGSSNKIHPKQVEGARGPQNNLGQTPRNNGQPRKYVPGVRTKMKVPTFANTPGKGPLRIPANYKFANERLKKP